MYIKTWTVYCMLRGLRLKFHKSLNYCFFFSLKIDFVSANSADPDEMMHNAAFCLGLHSLTKYPFRGFRSSKS